MGCIVAAVLACTVQVPDPNFEGEGPPAGDVDDGGGVDDTGDADDGEAGGMGPDDGGGDDGADDPGGSTGAGEGDAGDRCGNGVIEAPETCDGTDFAATTCADFGFDGGELSCTPSCVIVTDDCYGCGDGVVQATEVCDGSDVGGADCESLGFGEGALVCNDTCRGYDTRGCPPAPVCGDGVLNGTEDCEGADHGGATCISEGYSGGTLACAGDCTYDYTACTAQCGGFGTPCNQPGGCCGGGCGMGGSCTLNGVQVCCS